ncbi:hypothetical protein AGDE_15191 [Angomonas deanei]|nr:hypothetical protein AGDE_15191 [Angomonas deanei]|eukprot:EPY19535.1 hypothetical protein AGDE_15191 [Angomonas deanei]
MQLLALLRQNKFYGLYHVRLWLDSENGALLFNTLLRYSPADERVSSILMKKYSYLLDLLSWELGYLHVRHPEQLDVHFEGVSPTAVTVFFALFVAAQEKRMRLTSARKTEGLTARADMLEWLQHIIVGLPVLTSLRAPKDTSAYLVDTDDGVSLYDIGAVERDFTQERAASAMQPLSVDEMRAKLLPFVSANDCLLHYHNAVHFIKSWSSLMSLGVLCVRGIKLGFLHYTVDYLCDMMKKRLLCLSLESREHIVSYLSSIVGDCCHQMKLLCQHGTEEELQLVRVPVPDSTSGRTRLSGSADSTAFPPWEYSSVRQSKLTKGSLVRPRVEEDQHVSHPYSRMSELTSLIASCIVAKNVGEQVPLCRIGLYTGMIALLSIPGVELDQFLMNTELNYRRRILQLIVTDISSIFELPTGGATPSTVKNPSSAMVRSIAERISPLAITLLIIVLESTPLFFSEDATLLFGCVRGLLQQIDSQILYQEKSESSLKLIAGTFDLISLLGARDPSGLFSNGILSTCIDLQCWSVTPQVIADNNVSSMASSGTMLQAAVQLSDVAPVRRLLTHLIVGVIDGFNRCFQNQGMGRKFKFVREAQRFIRRHTPFLKYLLEEPFLQSSINLGITVFQLVTVEKITHLLRCFSDTCIVEECRFLREDMQLVALLRSLSSDESMYETSYYDIGQSNAASPFSKTLKMQPSVANEAQRRAMAKTVLNLSHFLLRTECGLWDRSLMDLAGVPHSFAEENRHYNIVNSLLRETPENVQMLLLILNSVTCCIDRVSKNARLTGSLCFLELSYEVRALWRLALLFDMIIQSLPSDGNGQQNRLLGDSYRQYLATLPLGELQRALEYAKKVLHALSEFNTDYEGSLSLQNVPGGYAIRAGSVLAHAGNALKAGGNTSKDNSEPPSPLINDPLQRSRMLNPSPPQTPRTPPQGGSGFRQDTAAGGRGNQNQPKANAVMRAVLNDGSVNPNAPIRIGACEDSYVHHRVGEVTGRFDAPQPQLTVVRDTNNRANQSTLGNVVQESIFTKMLNNTIHISDSQNGIHSNLNTNEQTAVVGPVALDPFQTQLDQLLQGEEQVVAHAGLGKIPDAEHIIALSGYVRNTKIEVVNTLHTLKRITQTQ